MKMIDLYRIVDRVDLKQILSFLKTIEFYRGKTFNASLIKQINRLHDDSLRKSTISSNEIENIRVSKSRFQELLSKRNDPSVYEDYMIMGYNRALKYVFDSYSSTSLNIVYILRLHKLMYERWDEGVAGNFKKGQNIIVKSENGVSKTMFIPPSPEETPALVDQLVFQFNDLWNNPAISKLVLIPCFIAEYIHIHPFADGNGRTSRLLNTFLLLKAGYDVEKYESVSYSVLKNLDFYYKALEKTDIGYQKDNNDDTTFVAFSLDMLAETYKNLSRKIEVNEKNSTAEMKIIADLKSRDEPLDIEDLRDDLFSLDSSSINDALSSLKKKGIVRSIDKNGKLEIADQILSHEKEL